MYWNMYWKLSVIYWFLFIKRIKKKNHLQMFSKLICNTFKINQIIKD